MAHEHLATIGTDGRVWLLDGRYLHRLEHGVWRRFANPVPSMALSTPSSLFEDGDITAGDLDGTFDKHKEINVYRIVQEGVSNLGRHARASSGRVTVAATDAEIEIRIDDDGIGFDPAAPRNDDRGGLGLTGIAERARILGGTLAIRSSAGQGTSISIRVPRRTVRPQRHVRPPDRPMSPVR